MTTPTARIVAVALAALAGFVDAVGFLALGGFYVAFMSGNSTLLSIGLASGADAHAPIAAALVGAFVVGVALGTVVGRPMGRYRPSGILLVMACLLATAATLAPYGPAAGLLLAVAMGAENTVFQHNGQLGIGLTYMTGTLARIGQRLGEAVMGGPWSAAVPDFLLWSGMVTGAVVGAALYARLGLMALWATVATSVALAAVTALDRRRVA